MSYILPNLESGEGREGWWFVLIHCHCCEIYISWGGGCQVHVQLVCDRDIIGDCRGLGG